MGKIDCADKDECDGNAVCLQNDKGNFYCQSTGATGARMYLCSVSKLCYFFFTNL